MCEPKEGPLFRDNFASGVLASADLGTQVLIAQMQAMIDSQQVMLDAVPALMQAMHETLTRLENVAAVMREAELGSPYWRTRT